MNFSRRIVSNPLHILLDLFKPTNPTKICMIENVWAKTINKTFMEIMIWQTKCFNFFGWNIIFGVMSKLRINRWKQTVIFSKSHFWHKLPHLSSWSCSCVTRHLLIWHAKKFRQKSIFFSLIVFRQKLLLLIFFPPTKSHLRLLSFAYIFGEVHIRDTFLHLYNWT